MLDELDLRRYAGVRARRMSLGNKQRLGLAAALQHRPDLIILDEPTNALDPAGVILLREALLRRAADGAGVLVSSHHLDEVARIAITDLGDRGGPDGRHASTRTASTSSARSSLWCTMRWPAPARRP